MSEEPVTFVPGSSFVFTRRATAKSVTAVATIGVLLVALATDCAAGVAIAKMSGYFCVTKRWAMLCRLDWSAWAFCWSNFTSMPRAFIWSTMPRLAASSALCSTS